jgi:hypothetical protein
MQNGIFQTFLDGDILLVHGEEGLSLSRGFVDARSLVDSINLGGFCAGMLSLKATEASAIVGEDQNVLTHRKGQVFWIGCGRERCREWFWLCR